MMRVEDAQNIFDLRDMAKRRLPKWLFEFVDRGTEDEVALHNNREAFERIQFRPRMLVDVSGRTLDTTLFGKEHKMPIGIAPTGAVGMMWYQGELELARAAKEAGIPFSLATGSITSMEKISAEVGGTLWMQLYMWADRRLSHQLVRRASAAGFEALLVTVDGVVAGNREYNRRNGFSVPFKYNSRNTTDVLMHPRWMFGVLGRYIANGGMPTRVNFPDELKGKITSAYGGSKETRNDSLNWDDLKALRDIWPGKLLVKGLLHPDDASKSLEYGADGIIVSNHGGRNCDAAPAPIEVLPEIVKAVGDRTTVLFDSGVRRGSDVVKALALGAKMVLIGRSTLYGTAAAGHAGATRALDIYRGEISRGMAQISCNRVSEIGPQHVALSGTALVSGGGGDRTAARDEKLRAIPGAKSA
ncbi:MAG: alpha-hydroxy-acid oxidizing protein [Betaproteobacteria bacterium]|nr:alpha-hydroxy-acid oxidizing protein [Betaproteobacteria bacterium]